MLKLLISLFLLTVSLELICQTIPPYVQTSRDLEIFLKIYKRDSIDRIRGEKAHNLYIEYLIIKNRELDDSTFMISTLENQYEFSCSRNAFQNFGLESDLSFTNSNIFNGTGRLNSLLSYFLKVPRSRVFYFDNPFYFDLKVDIELINSVDKKIELSNHFLKSLNLKLVKEMIDTCYLNLNIINKERVNNLRFDELEFEKQKKLVDGDREAISNLFEKRYYFQPIFNYWGRMEFASKNIVKMPEELIGEFAFSFDAYLLENCTLDEINTELVKSGLRLTEKIGKIDFYRFVKLNTN